MQSGETVSDESGSGLSSDAGRGRRTGEKPYQAGLQRSLHCDGQMPELSRTKE